MKKYGRIDANHVQIVSALRAAGATVHNTSAMGAGFPDILVNFRRVSYFFEVKDGNKPPSARELTPAQAKFHADWDGCTLMVVNSAEEALAAIGAVS